MYIDTATGSNVVWDTKRLNVKVKEEGNNGQFVRTIEEIVM